MWTAAQPKSIVMKSTEAAANDGQVRPPPAAGQEVPTQAAAHGQHQPEKGHDLLAGGIPRRRPTARPPAWPLPRPGKCRSRSA